MRAAPVHVPATTPLKDAVTKMAAARASAVMVTDDAGAIVGIVTEQDIARRMAFGPPAETEIGTVMTAPVAVIRDTDLLYHAIGRMRRSRLRHMPVVDRGGRAVGILELHDALAVGAGQMVDQIDRLTHEGSLEGLRRVKREQAAVASQLLADNVPAPDVLRLISDINCDLYRRVVDLACEDVRTAEGELPPLPFAVIVMGSGGRGESGLSADQDNGFIVADYPDAEHDRIDGYFRQLATRMTAMLDEVGLPLCSGDVMASNPLWRKTASQWCAQVDYWLRKRNAAILRLGDVFFDFQAAAGAHDLAERVRAHIAETLPGAYPFLQTMYGAQQNHRTALGLFGWFRREAEGPHKGMISLKYGGSLPLVEAVRLLALRAGIRETGTRIRIATLVEAGELAPGLGDDLTEAFSVITAATLRHQLADYAAGRPLTYWLRPRRVSARERRRLKAALRAVERLRSQVRSTFTGDVF